MEELAAENEALRKELRRCAEAAVDIFSSLPQSGAAWFESGRVFLRNLRHQHEEDQRNQTRTGSSTTTTAYAKTTTTTTKPRKQTLSVSPSALKIRVTVQLSPCAVGVSGKRAACWISSPFAANQTPSLVRLPQSSVIVSDSGRGCTVSVDVPALVPAWNDPTATLEWTAWAHSDAAIAVGSLVQAIETKPPSLQSSGDRSEFMDAISNGLKKKLFCVDSGDGRGRTLLHAAAAAGNTELVTWLVAKKKATVDSLDNDKWTPLFSALSAGHFSTAIFLMTECSADAQHRSTNGSTALHALCTAAPDTADERGFTKVLDKLIGCGVNVEEARADGNTPLMLVCRQRTNSDARAAALLAQGADPNRRNNNGEYPLHIAVLAGASETIRVLGKFGADESKRGSSGKTALEMAEASHVPQVVDAVKALRIHVEGLSEQVLGLIMAYLPPADICNARRACRMFQRIGSLVFQRDDYWAAHGTTKNNFQTMRLLELRYGHDLELWEPTTVQEQDVFLKIVVVGDSGVGKSSFIRCACGEQFSPDHINEGFPWRYCKRRAPNNRVIRFQLWELQCSARGDAVIRRAYDGASAVIVMFDLYRSHTGDSVPKYLEIIQSTAFVNGRIPVVAVGNKCDTAMRMSTNDALSCVHDASVPVLFTSAKTGKNVELALKIAADMCLNTTDESQRSKDCLVM